MAICIQPELHELRAEQLDHIWQALGCITAFVSYAFALTVTYLDSLFKFCLLLQCQYMQLLLQC